MPLADAKQPEHFLVVGGTTGSGRVLVRRLLSAGQRVTVIGRHRPAELQQWPELNVEILDLSEQAAIGEAIARAAAQFGPPNHLVFYQRYRGGGDQWGGELETTLTGTKAVIAACASLFESGRNQAIVAVGSAASRFVLEEQPVSYHAAKAALLQMMRYYAVTLGPKGVRANVVSPDTVIKEESRQVYEDNPALTALYKKITPLGRLGTSEDIASAVAYLCSNEASFITGQDLVVDGGISLVGQVALARKLAGINDLKLNR
jgi:3-oxoacyl-[acyl-carrier protein] reductase